MPTHRSVIVYGASVVAFLFYLATLIVFFEALTRNHLAIVSLEFDPERDRLLLLQSDNGSSNDNVTTSSTTVTLISYAQMIPFGTVVGIVFLLFIGIFVSIANFVDNWPFITADFCSSPPPSSPPPRSLWRGVSKSLQTLGNIIASGATVCLSLLSFCTMASWGSMSDFSYSQVGDAAVQSVASFWFLCLILWIPQLFSHYCVAPASRRRTRLRILMTKSSAKPTTAATATTGANRNQSRDGGSSDEDHDDATSSDDDEPVDDTVHTNDIDQQEQRDMLSGMLLLFSGDAPYEARLFALRTRIAITIGALAAIANFIAFVTLAAAFDDNLFATPLAVATSTNNNNNYNSTATSTVLVQRMTSGLVAQLCICCIVGCAVAVFNTLEWVLLDTESEAFEDSTRDDEDEDDDNGNSSNNNITCCTRFYKSVILPLFCINSERRKRLQIFVNRFAVGSHVLSGCLVFIALVTSLSAKSRGALPNDDVVVAFWVFLGIASAAQIWSWSLVPTFLLSRLIVELHNHEADMREEQELRERRELLMSAENGFDPRDPEHLLDDIPHGRKFIDFWRPKNHVVPPPDNSNGSNSSNGARRSGADESADSRAHATHLRSMRVRATVARALTDMRHIDGEQAQHWVRISRRAQRWRESAPFLFWQRFEKVLAMVFARNKVQQQRSNKSNSSNSIKKKKPKKHSFVPRLLGNFHAFRVMSSQPTAAAAMVGIDEFANRREQEQHEEEQQDQKQQQQQGQRQLQEDEEDDDSELLFPSCTRLVAVMSLLAASPDTAPILFSTFVENEKEHLAKGLFHALICHAGLWRRVHLDSHVPIQPPQHLAELGTNPNNNNNNDDKEHDEEEEDCSRFCSLLCCGDDNNNGKSQRGKNRNSNNDARTRLLSPQCAREFADVFPALLQKAQAKLLGSYAAVAAEVGDALDTLHDLAGVPVERFTWWSSSDAIATTSVFVQIEEALVRYSGRIAETALYPVVVMTAQRRFGNKNKQQQEQQDHDENDDDIATVLTAPVSRGGRGMRGGIGCRVVAAVSCCRDEAEGRAAVAATLERRRKARAAAWGPVGVARDDDGADDDDDDDDDDGEGQGETESQQQGEEQQGEKQQQREHKEPLRFILLDDADLLRDEESEFAALRRIIDDTVVSDGDLRRLLRNASACHRHQRFCRPSSRTVKRNNNRKKERPASNASTTTRHGPSSSTEFAVPHHSFFHNNGNSGSNDHDDQDDAAGIDAFSTIVPLKQPLPLMGFGKFNHSTASPALCDRPDIQFQCREAIATHLMRTSFCVSDQLSVCTLADARNIARLFFLEWGDAVSRVFSRAGCAYVPVTGFLDDVADVHASIEDNGLADFAADEAARFQAIRRAREEHDRRHAIAVDIPQQQQQQKQKQQQQQDGRSRSPSPQDPENGNNDDDQQQRRAQRAHAAEEEATFQGVTSQTPLFAKHNFPLVSPTTDIRLPNCFTDSATSDWILEVTVKCSDDDNRNQESEHEPALTAENLMRHHHVETSSSSAASPSRRAGNNEKKTTTIFMGLHQDDARPGVTAFLVNGAQHSQQQLQCCGCIYSPVMLSVLRVPFKKMQREREQQPTAEQQEEEGEQEAATAAATAEDVPATMITVATTVNAERQSNNGAFAADRDVYLRVELEASREGETYIIVPRLQRTHEHLYVSDPLSEQQLREKERREKRRAEFMKRREQQQQQQHRRPQQSAATANPKPRASSVRASLPQASQQQQSQQQRPRTSSPPRSRANNNNNEGINNSKKKKTHTIRNRDGSSYTICLEPTVTKSRTENTRTIRKVYDVWHTTTTATAQQNKTQQQPLEATTSSTAISVTSTPSLLVPREQVLLTTTTRHCPFVLSLLVPKAHHFHLSGLFPGDASNTKELDEIGQHANHHHHYQQHHGEPTTSSVAANRNDNNITIFARIIRPWKWLQQEAAVHSGSSLEALARSLKALTSTPAVTAAMLEEAKLSVLSVSQDLLVASAQLQQQEQQQNETAFCMSSYVAASCATASSSSSSSTGRHHFFIENLLSDVPRAQSANRLPVAQIDSEAVF